MSTKIQTIPGHALPPAPRHAITTHIPSWQAVLRFRDRDPELMKTLHDMYPRFIPHRDIKELMQKVIAYTSSKEACLLFPAAEAAKACKAFATSPARGDGTLSDDQITIRAFNIADVYVYGVFVPPASMPTISAFWTHAGVGISSRLAEHCLAHIDTLHEIQLDLPQPRLQDASSHVLVKRRIAELLNRAPADPQRTAKVSPDDVYLFQTGMSAIYWVHRYLLSKHNSSSVLFGFAFHSTIHVLGDFGPGVEFFGHGTDEDLKKLEQFLAAQAEEGKSVQAIWTEFPSNPLLVTPDLKGLRRVADQYGALLIVDDTIGSFCNVDVMGVADVVLTSLTKSFSGYADVMAASAVLSPLSARYSELKQLFETSYRNDFFAGDAEALERNSRNYLERSATMNNNAARLVEYLQEGAENPASPVKQVYYPTVDDTSEKYRAFMRAQTPDFSPGYGCLFSVEFDNQETTIAFYDNLNVHQGPHLGAHLTLALAYTMGIYGKDLEWAARYNMRPEQIRISVGLEDTQTLLADFKIALKAAKKCAEAGQSINGGYAADAA
ncbi:pyridoxal phosphate-dependent transferase [Exophiala viscosa]|uniref:pyridoxal phosphate-dependent transferase n=1 Tax=Exophiala viscosa TaxID=2486360 RepID=UPI00218EF74A|nr:pyridoxal phosphate-dependent transferase [Exophiala viscosa]